MPESASRPRILLVDDDPTIARLIARIVGEVGFGPIDHVTTGREALGALDGFDIALLDGSRPALEAGADLVLQLPFDPGSFTAQMIRLAEEEPRRRPSPRAD